MRPIKVGICVFKGGPLAPKTGEALTLVQVVNLRRIFEIRVPYPFYKKVKN